MKRKVLSLVVVASLGFVWGCPVVPGPGPEAVLEGTWSITPAEPGDFADRDFEAVFDGLGNLTTLSGTREDGATATLDTTGATTELVDDQVTISIPDAAGTRVFTGTLSDDQNTMTGSITQEIDLGDLEATLPGGDLTLERL